MSMFNILLTCIDIIFVLIVWCLSILLFGAMQNYIADLKQCRREKKKWKKTKY